jgi:hypothetical protein
MKILSLFLIGGMLTGCASGLSRNGVGLIYTDVKDSVGATSNSGSSKQGTSCATNILALVSTGDMSIEGARKSAGITRVASVDYTQYSILGVYGKTCVVVAGD